jgi:hypothetical protein
VCGCGGRVGELGGRARCMWRVCACVCDARLHGVVTGGLQAHAACATAQSAPDAGGTERAVAQAA